MYSHCIKCFLACNAMGYILARPFRSVLNEFLATLDNVASFKGMGGDSTGRRLRMFISLRGFDLLICKNFIKAQVARRFTERDNTGTALFIHLGRYLIIWSSNRGRSIHNEPISDIEYNG